MDLTKLTLEKLRDLARKHLKRGYSKLSKAELVQALKAYVSATPERAPGSAARKAKVASGEEPAASGRERPRSAGAPATRRGPTRKAAEGAATEPKRAAAKKPTRAAAPPRRTAKVSGSDELPPRAAEARATGKGARAAAKPGSAAPATRRAAHPPPRAEVQTPVEPASPPAADLATNERPTPERSEREEISARAPDLTLELPARAPGATEAGEAPRVRSQGGAPAEVFTFAPGPRRAAASTADSTPAEAARSARAHAAPQHEQHEQHDAEPLIEGFFVARIAGEHELRRHHLLESMTAVPREASGGGHDEGLGELPARYHDADRVVLLPRDPSTVFAFWSFRPETVVRASEGLEEPRPVLRLFDDRSFRRQVDIGLDLPGYYVHSVESGRAYRVEVHLIGRDGRSRRLGPSSNRVQVPWFGPSDDTEVRFMRIPPDVGVEQLGDAVQRGAVQVRPVAAPKFVEWKRTALPHSATLPGSGDERLSPQDVEVLTGPGFERPPRSGSSNWTTPPRSGRSS